MQKIIMSSHSALDGKLRSWDQVWNGWQIFGNLSWRYMEGPESRESVPIMAPSQNIEDWLGLFKMGKSQKTLQRKSLSSMPTDLVKIWGLSHFRSFSYDSPTGAIAIDGSENLIGTIAFLWANTHWRMFLRRYSPLSLITTLRCFICG
jgi:hypothetical protein